LTPQIERLHLRRFLGEVYGARSKFAHTGSSFPAHVEMGISNFVGTEAVVHGLALSGSHRFVPAFPWFERLTHLVLREYLLRVIAAKPSDDSAKNPSTLAPPGGPEQSPGGPEQSLGGPA
jgi:hypothetical protein